MQVPFSLHQEKGVIQEEPKVWIQRQSFILYNKCSNGQPRTLAYTLNNTRELKISLRIRAVTRRDAFLYLTFIK